MYLKYPLFFFTSTPGWKGLHFNYGLGYKAHLVWVKGGPLGHAESMGRLPALEGEEERGSPSSVGTVGLQHLEWPDVP